MWRRGLLLLTLLLVIFGIAWLAHDALALDRLMDHEADLRYFLTTRPITAFCVGFVVYVALSLVPMTGGKSILYGWLFGFWAGTVLVSFALTLAATCAFLFSRYALRDLVQRRMGVVVERVNRALERDGVGFLLVLRVTHFPYTIANYACGATNLSVRDFWWATQLGMLPATALFVYAGAQLPTLRQVVRASPWSLVSPQLFLAVSLVSLLPVLIRHIARQKREARS